jgi:hypothetical protein
MRLRSTGWVVATLRVMPAMIEGSPLSRRCSSALS